MIGQIVKWSIGYQTFLFLTIEPINALTKFEA
jgi:hypothetical protein